MPALTPDLDLDRFVQRYVGAGDSASLRNSPYRRNELERYARLMSDSDVTLSLDDEEGRTARVHANGDSPHIEIPSWEIPQPVTDYRRRAYDMLMQRMLTLHEVGHVCYTDEAAVTDATAQVDPGRRDEFRSLWNALEDAAIEAQLRREYDVADELEVMNANYMDPGGDRGSYGLLGATHLACLDVGVYDTGRLRRLLDPADGDVAFTSAGARATFREDVLPLVRDAVGDVLTDPDPQSRTERILDFWDELAEHLEDAPSSDVDEPLDDGKGDHAEGSGAGRDATRLDDASPDDVEGRVRQVVGGGGDDEGGADGDGGSDDDGEPAEGDADTDGDGESADGDADTDGDGESVNDDADTDGDGGLADGDADADADGDTDGDGGLADDDGGADGDGGTDVDGDADADGEPADDGTESTPDRTDESDDDRPADGDSDGSADGDSDGSADGDSGERNGSLTGSDAGDRVRNGETPSPTGEATADSSRGSDSRASSPDTPAAAGATPEEGFGSGDVFTGDVGDTPDRDPSLESEYLSLVDRETERQGDEREAVEADLAAFQRVLERLGDSGEGPDRLEVVTGGEVRESAWTRARSDGRQLQRILDRRLRQEQRSQWRRGRHRGRVDPRSLPRVAANDPRIFRQRDDPEEKDYAAAIILDRSGSMSTDIHDAEQATVALAFGLEELGIDVCVLDFRYGPRLAKPFGASVTSRRDALLTGETGGGTPLASTLALARERIRDRGGHPFGVVVTDGQPSNKEDYLEVLQTTSFPVLGVYLARDARSIAHVSDEVMDSARLFDRRTIVTSSDSLLDSLRGLCREVMF